MQSGARKIAPAPVCDDDTCDERTESRSDESAAQEEAIGCTALDWAIDVADDRTTTDQERCTLEGSQQPHDEVASQVRRQRRSSAKSSERDSRYGERPLATVSRAQWTVEQWRQAHEDQVQRVGDIEDRARSVVRSHDFGRG